MTMDVDWYREQAEEFGDKAHSFMLWKMPIAAYENARLAAHFARLVNSGGFDEILSLFHSIAKGP